MSVTLWSESVVHMNTVALPMFVEMMWIDLSLCRARIAACSCLLVLGLGNLVFEEFEESGCGYG